MKLILSLCVAVLVLTGCSGTGGNKPLTKAVYTVAVSSGVSVGTARYPEATPYVRVANTLICASATGTNVSPAEIVAAIQASPAAEAAATPTGKLVVNGVLVLYAAVFDQGIENETAREWLQWTCDAVTMGLPPEPIPANARTLQPLRAPRVLPPHLR